MMILIAKMGSYVVVSVVVCTSGSCVISVAMVTAVSTEVTVVVERMKSEQNALALSRNGGAAIAMRMGAALQFPTANNGQKTLGGRSRGQLTTWGVTRSSLWSSEDHGGKEGECDQDLREHHVEKLY